MQKHRVTVRYRGMVQGVGFRFTAVHTAHRYPGITGYVRNMPDGSVELVAEGDREEVERFLDEVSHQMSGYIRDERRTWSEPTGQFGGFGIRR